MKRFRTAAILALVIFALGGLATWDEWKTKSDEEAAKTKNRLTEWKVEDVVELDYYSASSIEDSENPDGTPTPTAAVSKDAPVAFTLVKKDGVWRVVKPVEALAEEQAVNGLIKTIVEYTYGKVIAESQDKWADFGLKEPQRRIVLKTANGDSSSIFLGDKAPVGYHVYVRTSQDDKTYLGSQYLLTSTAKTLLEMRDKTLVKIDSAAVSKLIYEKLGSAPIEVGKQADGKFLITQPQTLAADPAEVRDLLESLSNARVAGFEDRPAAEVGAAFAHPTYRITWQDDKGTATSLQVIEQAGKFLAALDPSKQVMLLPDDLGPKLDRDLTSFRNRRVLAVDASELASIEVDGTGYKLVNGDWFTLEDAAKVESMAGKSEAKDAPKEKAHIRAFVVDLEFAKTDRFYESADPQIQSVVSSAPEHRIVLGFKAENKPKMTLELFKSPDANDKYVVRRSDVDALYRISTSAFASMTPNSAPAPKVEEGGDEKGEFEGGSLGPMDETLDFPLHDDRDGDAGTG